MTEAAGRALDFNLQLDEADLAWFKSRLDAARDNRGAMPEADILSAVRELQSKAATTSPPQFVRARLARLDELIAMLEDADWKLEGEDRALVLDALAYFADPDDLIPDDTPVLGLVDDAIMIDLVCVSLQPEREAYADFCEARDELAKSPPKEETAEQKLAQEREFAQSRMRRRRGRRSGGWPHAGVHNPFSARF